MNKPLTFNHIFCIFVIGYKVINTPFYYRTKLIPYAIGKSLFTACGLPYSLPLKRRVLVLLHRSYAFGRSLIHKIMNVVSFDIENGKVISPALSLRFDNWHLQSESDHAYYCIYEHLESRGVVSVGHRFNLTQKRLNNLLYNCRG